MKAIEITSIGELKIVHRDLPKVGRNEVLLRLRYVGFCGSDLSTYMGKNPLVEYPRIPGHEISAVIEEIGANVPESFKAGQRVTVIPYTSCGHCTACKRKVFNACRFNQTLGVQRDGAMCEYMAVDWQKVLLEEELNDVQLAMVEPLTIGFHAIENGKVTDLDEVMVLGSGMIGSGAIIRASLRGATVIAVDIDDSKLAVAKKLGAKHVINSRTHDLHAELDRITNGNGPSVVVEAAGSPITYKAAIEEVAFAGRVICIGYAGSDIALSTKLWVQKELQILGSRNANPSDFEAVIKFLKERDFDEGMLLTSKVKPEDAVTAMKNWTDAPEKVMKILVDFD